MWHQLQIVRKVAFIWNPTSKYTYNYPPNWNTKFKFYIQIYSNVFLGNGPTLDRLLSFEKNYQQMLSQLVHIYSTPLTPTADRPPILTNQLSKVYHIIGTNQMFIIRLRQIGGHTVKLFEAYSEWIRSTSILIQEYAANCALAIEAIRNAYTLDKDEMETIKEHLYYPYEHVERQRKYLRQMGIEQLVLNLEKSVVEECDTIESELYECASLTKDNLLVNFLPGVSGLFLI